MVDGEDGVRKIGSRLEVIRICEICLDLGWRGNRLDQKDNFYRRINGI